MCFQCQKCIYQHNTTSWYDFFQITFPQIKKCQSCQNLIPRSTLRCDLCGKVDNQVNNFLIIVYMKINIDSCLLINTVAKKVIYTQ